MMSVSFKNFEKWAKKRFGDENVKVQGKEIRLNSIFESDDDDFHLWCNPSGGKKKRKNGTFHCFKTGQKGSLVKLIMLVDSCDRDDALSKLNGQTSIRELEKQLEELFAAQDQTIIAEKPKVGINLPEHCHLISELGTNNWWRKKAEEYLQGRKLPIDGLYICTDGRYKARIIIPYYDRNGTLIYFNGRHLGNSRCKYLGPPKEIGVGKEDVIFMAGKWPESSSLVYVCEGELNAISMKQAEFNAVACGGKNMSEKQAMLLSDYRVVLCLDRDKAGKAGTTKMSSMITAIETAKKTTEKLLYVIPPNGYNDWNEFLIKNNAVLLHHYVLKNQKSLDYSGPRGTIGDYFGFSDIWR
jgi:hypothetical protein